jgi:uncharacterized protein
MMKPFQKTQFEFTRYLRDPESVELPEKIQPERMQVYVDLIYNNTEGFISGAFPVLRSIIPEAQWHELVRDFIKIHSAQTPYFLQISQEFLTFLFQHSHPLKDQFPFMLALAHYEWVELALDVSEETLPEPCQFPDDLLNSRVTLSPLAMILSYPWPVQKISSLFIPTSETETHLLVYRDRLDQVQFIELSSISSRLLQLCRDNSQKTMLDHLTCLKQEIGASIFSDHQIKAFCGPLKDSEILFFDLSSN